MWKRSVFVILFLAQIQMQTFQYVGEDLPEERDYQGIDNSAVYNNQFRI